MLWGLGYLILAVVVSLLLMMIVGLMIGRAGGPAIYIAAGAFSEEIARLAVCLLAGFTRRKFWLIAALPGVAFEYIPIFLKADWGYLTGLAAALGLKSLMSLIHVSAFVIIGWAVWRRSAVSMAGAVVFCSAVHWLNNWYGANLISMSPVDWGLFAGNIALIATAAIMAWRAAGPGALTTLRPVRPARHL